MSPEAKLTDKLVFMFIDYFLGEIEYLVWNKVQMIPNVHLLYIIWTLECPKTLHTLLSF